MLPRRARRRTRRGPRTQSRRSALVEYQRSRLVSYLPKVILANSPSIGERTCAQTEVYEIERVRQVFEDGIEAIGTGCQPDRHRQHFELGNHRIEISPREKTEAVVALHQCGGGEILLNRQMREGIAIRAELAQKRR